MDDFTFEFEEILDEDKAGTPVSWRSICDEFENGESSMETFAYEEPVAKEPVAKEPVAKESVAKESVNEEPVAEESIEQEPVEQESVVEETDEEESVDEGTAAEEPVEEGPVEEGSVEEEPFELTWDDAKMWLFRESIRQAEAREELNREKTSFAKEQAQGKREFENKEYMISVMERQAEMKLKMADEKLAILEKEYLRLDHERKQFEEEKKTYENIRKFTRPVQNITYIGMDVLFQGVDNEVALKKRYRDLLKIFHPDNLGGDDKVIQNINKAYDDLRKKYS